MDALPGAWPRARSESTHSSASCNVDHFDRKDDSGGGNTGYGDKKITFWGSCCLNLNNCMGPAMVLLPLLNQQAGWLTPTIALTVAWLMSSFAATMLCEAMQRIPGNHNFEHRYEFATTVKHYYGHKIYLAFQVFFNLSMQASNVAAMIISAQVVDRFVAKISKGTSYGLDYERWVLTKSITGTQWCEKFEGDTCHNETTWVISVGYIICMAICIPFGYMNLDDNMWFQWFSVIGLLLFTSEFFFQFIYNICNANADNESYTFGNPNATIPHNAFESTPMFGGLTSQSQVIGVAVFAYAYVVTIPSWVNEKKTGVSINRTVWYPATLGLLLKVAVGMLGSWAFATIPASGDDIVELLLGDHQPIYTQYSAYLWDITTLIPGIPVLAVMVRYNLLSGNVCGKYGAFFWGVVFPWLVTAFCYEKDALSLICTWVAIVVQGYINFVIPAMLYRTALLRYPNANDATWPGDVGAEPLLTMAGESINDVTTKRSEPPVNAVPRYILFCGKKFWLNRLLITNTIIILFSFLSTLAIVLNIIYPSS